eukprot:15259757-Alexandrium_andersonii.AAC.1
MHWNGPLFLAQRRRNPWSVRRFFLRDGPERSPGARRGCRSPARALRRRRLLRPETWRGFGSCHGC